MSSRRSAGDLGGEQSGHIIWLDGHVTGDGLVAALLLCAALDGRTLEEAVSVLELMPQALENVPAKEIPELRAQIDAIGAGNGGRVLVSRPAPNRSFGCSRRRKPLKVRGICVQGSPLS